MLNLGLIGHHINNSQAGNLIQKLGKEFDVALNYQIFNLENDNNNIDKILSNLKKNLIKGVNVTYPYKETIINYCNILNEEVHLIKSSNTIIFADETIVAHNTDYLGLLKMIEFHQLKQNQKLLIIGGGGIGRSVSFSMGSKTKAEIFLYEKDSIKAKKLNEDLNKNKIICHLMTEREVIANNDLFDGIINCTPIGHESTPGVPLPNLIIKNNQWIFDAIYVPAETELLKKAKKLNCNIIYGIDLFIFQGIESFLIFSEREDLREKIYLQFDNIRKYFFEKLL
jgi:shikimate dehydrogenase